VVVLDTLFPLSVAFGTTGGPERATEIVRLGSGHEARNARWAGSRRRYDAGAGVRSVTDLKAVLGLFEEAHGQLFGFRFRDPLEHSTAAPGSAISAQDCPQGTGDGSNLRFALVRTYGGSAQPRPIRYPRLETLQVAIDGTILAQPAEVFFDTASGELVFTVPPTAGAAITAGFEFDVPVRFDTDRLEISLSHFEAGSLPSIPLIEILPEAAT